MQIRVRRRRPWGLRAAKLPPLSGAPGRPGEVALYTSQKEASPSLGAANCETDAAFWEAQRSGVIRKPEGDLAVPGGRELRNCRHVRGPLRDPAEWCHTQIRMRPRRPWSCELRSCRQFRWLMGWPTEWGHTQIRMRPRRPGRGCELRKCRYVRGLLGDPAAWCYTQIRMRPRRPLGAAHSKTVATFVVCWRVQLSDLIRRSE